MGHAPNQQLIVGHRLGQAHLEATIVVMASFWHSCCWWAPPTPARFARFPLPLRCEDSAAQEGALTASCFGPVAYCFLSRQIQQLGFYFRLGENPRAPAAGPPAPERSEA